MKKLLLFFISVIISSSVLAQQEERALITEEQAVSIARQFAIDRKIVTEKWFGEYAHASFDGKEWGVFFLPYVEDGKAMTLDNDLLIYLSPYGEVLSPSRP